jgi:hypothetical protein
VIGILLHSDPQSAPDETCSELFAVEYPPWTWISPGLSEGRSETTSFSSLKFMTSPAKAVALPGQWR